MEHSHPHPIPSKRKASQSSPVQEHRCVPQEDPSPDCALLHEAQSTPSVNMPDPSPLYDVDEDNARKPKRPRLSLDAQEPPSTDSRSRRSPPPRKRATPRPPSQPQPKHDEPSRQEQQYLLQRRGSLPPSSGSLLSPLAESPVTASPTTTTFPPQIYVPPPLPTITRDTLRELDLEAILKNPQLRHDLLFDPGLQFRPTTGQRKQLAADRYWVAVLRDLEHGCTCAAWDATGVILACRCHAGGATFQTRPKDGPSPSQYGSKTKRTRPPTPPPWSNKHYNAYLDAAADPRLDNALGSGSAKVHEVPRPPFQIRVPSRVGPMLHELVAVIKCVMMPPPLPCSHGSTTTPPRRPPPQYPSDVQNLLTHIDPSLIEQELRRGIFDPTGFFGLVGDTLKRHCAPMRDRQIDAMVSVVKSSERTVTQRAVVAMRLSFEILELMKLDIANHQLQHLRPFLATSTPEFELRVFIERCRRGLTSPRVAREWLKKAWNQVQAGPIPAGLVADHSMKVDDTPAVPMTAHALSRRSLVQLSLINAITSLVFHPPSTSPHSSDWPIPWFGYPETLYLDKMRMNLLAGDAADLTALYMLLMLWRQLVFWSPENGENKGEGQTEDIFPPYARAASRLEDWEMDRVKREIWEVGPRHIGSCFIFSGSEESDEDVGEVHVRWRRAMQNVALQIAMRAEEARTCTSSESALTAVPATTRRPPSQEALELMSGWIRTHMRRDSALADRLKELLQQEVIHAVTRLTLAAGVSNETVPGSSGVKGDFIPQSGGGTAGLEPLMPEIRHLAQRLARLVLVNMRVYWGLYAADGFLIDKTDVETG